jgi:PAS domain S-box-containing protein
LRGFIVFVRDVTERKTTEEALRQSEERYRLLAEHSRDVIVAFDHRVNPVYISPSAHELYGYTLEDFADEPVFSVIHPADRAAVQERVRTRMAGERPSTPLSFRLYTKAGELRWVEAAGSFLYDNTGSLRRVVVNYHDVTRRVEAETKLKAAVEEKESLMQELNHRVKNNLKMVSSLVHLKDGALGDQVDLSDIQHQIDAIRIVHQKLHQRADITHIDFREYVHDLLQTIFSFFTGKEVTIENEVEARAVPTRTAVPLGLIINETATNAIKHGFVDGTEAGFTVSLRPEPSHQSARAGKAETRYCLRIANTGRPFPEDIDPRSAESLGLQLISGLVSQIRGSLELQRSPHPVYSIRFPMPEA